MPHVPAFLRSRRQALAELRWWLATFLVLAAVVLPLRAAVADWYDVPSGSMRPTLVEGDRIVVDNRAFGLRIPLTHRWIARWDEPRRGDVVTLASPETGERLVKRVVGVAGDEIELRGGELWLNGEAVDYSVEDAEVREPLPSGGEAGAVHLREDLPRAPHTVTLLRDERIDPRRLPREFGPFEVPPGEVFVLGDNRDLSHDSRFFGSVPVPTVTGRAHHVAFSLDPEHGRRPRADRWWRDLE